tara:strand:- start:143 stop:646 length:504 start_codon:yes stop_codon:yes gene_type:complete
MVFFVLTSIYATEQSCMSEAQLSKFLQESIKHNSVLKDFPLSVSVANYDVEIKGTVESKTDLGILILLAMKQNCVKAVNITNVKVTNAKKESLSDVVVSATIMGKLMQNNFMSSNTKTWTIGIDTNNGIVNLTGNVKTQAKKDKIIKIINSVDGVKSINDTLTVKST